MNNKDPTKKTGGGGGGGFQGAHDILIGFNFLDSMTDNKENEKRKPSTQIQP